MDTKQVNTLFEGRSWYNFHNAVFDATNKSYSEERLVKLFLLLPNHIQSIAFEWGLSDNEFNDMVIKHIRGYEHGKG